MTLGERVKQRRERQGWSQGELSRRADVDPSLLSRIESGATENPGIRALKKLARTLGCSLDYLVDLYDDAHTDASCGSTAVSA